MRLSLIAMVATFARPSVTCHNTPVIHGARKERMHARNRFRAGYDFHQLAAAHPVLAPFIRRNAYGDTSIDYGNAEAVRALNRALLAHGYGVQTWDVPPGYLCPPIPGRSDYLHHLADLLASEDASAIPRGRSVVVLDIGVGASCIYPLIGASEYGWRFVGSEIDAAALSWARKLAADNPPVAGLIECRRQSSPTECFSGVIAPGEVFTLSMCNPPFHASAEAAAAAALRKQQRLQVPRERRSVLNFGGQPGELWCDGGELEFIRRMIAQSAHVANRCRWFTTLVSKSGHLPRLYATLRQTGAVHVKTIGTAQGQKQSRILAWTFATD